MAPIVLRGMGSTTGITSHDQDVRRRSRYQQAVGGHIKPDGGPDLQPGEESAWDRSVKASPTGTFFHLSGWCRVIEQVLGRRCFALTARAENRICGIFPLAWVRSRIFG